MLDLLLAADRAATTPERRELFDGLLEGQDRLVERAMEADTDHGELLGDDFFWCFMGLAMAQGDSAFWRTMGNWGYDLNCKVRHPDEDSDASVELGVWGAAFLPPERLDWLVKKGMLAPFKPVHRINNAGSISAAEYGMLVGSAETFDYWAPKWQAHYQNNDRRRDTDKGFHVPLVLNLILGLQSWREAEQPRVPFPDNGLSEAEIQRRIDAIAESVMAVQYPKSPRTERLMPFLKRPAFLNSNDAHTQGLVRWLVEQEANPWTHGETLHVLKHKEWDLLKALLQNGAPLNPDGQQGLATALVKAVIGYDDNRDWNKKHVGCAKAFVDRARTEDPAAFDQFFFPSGQEPAVVQCIQKGRFANASALFVVGCPGDISASDGKSVGALLLNQLRKANGLSEGWKQAWGQWLKALPEPDRLAHVQRAATEEQSWSPKALPLDIALVKKHGWDGLETLVRTGFPLSGPGAHGASFGHQLLLEVGNDPDLAQMAQAWDAYRKKAAKDPAGGLDPNILNQSIYKIERDWETHMSFWVRAAAFDEVLPEPAPKRGPKPRF